MGNENSQPVFFDPKPKLNGGVKTHKQNVLKRYGLKDTGYSLDELAKISSVPLDILQQVYNRGIGAYKTQPQSVRLKGSFVKNVDAPLSKKLSKEQWAMARVYSFLDGNPKHDDDLRTLKGSGKYSKIPVADLPEDLQEVIADPLDDSEIRKYLPDAKIIKYNQLSRYNMLTQLLPQETDYVIILYEDSPNSGHWVCLLRYNKGPKGTFEFFDPYGNTPDKQLTWTSRQNRQKLGQGRKLLTPLLNCAVQDVVYNPIKYQQDGGEINDCGRHCVFRIKCLLDKGMDLDAYFEYMKQLENKLQLPADGIVSTQINICDN